MYRGRRIRSESAQTKKKKRVRNEGLAAKKRTKKKRKPFDDFLFLQQVGITGLSVWYNSSLTC
nr:MAG TPA: hypothetical protein [Caudoviricetes sp.]